MTRTAEEAAFWQTRQMGPEVEASPKERRMDESLATRAGLRTSPIPVRFDADTVRRLTTPAAKKGTGYQTLPKAFVMEWLYK